MFQFFIKHPSFVAVSFVGLGIAVGVLFSLVWWAAFCALCGVSFGLFLVGQRGLGTLFLAGVIVTLVGALSCETEGLQEFLESLK